MKVVEVFVEGQTEETFIKRILNPHFEGFNILLKPTIAETKSSEGRVEYKGGYLKYSKVKKQIKRLLAKRGVVAVSSMLDYYGLPKSYPGKHEAKGDNCYERVKYLEEQFQSDINDRRFIPYFSLHEFEALLFSSPSQISLPDTDKNIQTKLQKIAANVQSPEEIDDGQQTHPSARIKALIPNFQKNSDGPIVARKIGILAMRDKCPHFNGWLLKLEELGSKT